MVFNADSIVAIPLEPLPQGQAVPLFRAVFAASFEAALLTRPSGEFLAANAAACAVFGASEQELLERSREGGHRSLADADDERLTALLAERAARGSTRGPVRLRRVDGSLFDAEVSSFLFLDEAGLATSVLLVRDLSAVRNAERMARESAQRLSFALDAAQIGDWDMDLRTNVARRSLRHDQCFGYSSPVAEWGYDTFLAHVDAADRSRVDACYQAAMAGKGDYDVEFRVTWPDGTLHWLWSKGCFYFDDEGRPVRVAGIQVDVTERRLAKEALERSEERLQLAMRASSDALWDYDLRTGVPYYSPRWLQMVGLPEALSPLDPDLWLRHCHPEDVDRVRETFEGILAGRQETYELEFRLLHRDGHTVPVLSRGFVLRDADGAALRVSGTNTDLTESNRLRDAENARMAAEAANRAKSEFLSRMSHELRTPLNAVLGFAQLLAINPNEPLSPRQARQVKLIEQGGKHLLKMVDEILDLSRIDSGHVQVNDELVDVPTLLRECVAMVQADADARTIQIACRLDPEASVVTADRTRLQQVLLNLLTNAIKYTQPGGKVSLASNSLEGHRVELSVTDNGPGLTAAQQSRLFEPFNRLGQEHGPTTGTGIGLVISKRLTELMRGTLALRSAPGMGCDFSVVLLAPSGPPSMMVDTARDRFTGVQDNLPRSGRLLYIEDDNVNAELMRGFLSTRPHLELIVERSARDGISAALRTTPDLILLDMQLPDLSGLEVLQQLKENPVTASIPVVVVSASAMPGTVSAATEAGAAVYLTKPIRLQSLLAALDRHLPQPHQP